MIKKLLIKNFRSIENLEIYPEQICTLIGANSTGKSNVLKALNILLGEIYPTERAFTRDDFFKRETNRTIEIKVWFDQPLKAVKLTKFQRSEKDYCSAVSLSLTYRASDQERVTSLIAEDEDGNKFYGSSGVRDQLSFIYIPSVRDLEKQMTVSSWTLLGKILGKVNDNFRSNPTSNGLSHVENKFRASMNQPREILESDFCEDLTYKKFKDTFVDICVENTNGLANNFKLDLEIYDPLFYYKTIQILGREDFDEYHALELGTGVQNLILLSLFRAYGVLMKSKAVLAIEEPELFLHPQAQRNLYKSFRELAYPENENGTQIFFTTHNPSFIDPSKAYELEILYKESGEGTNKYSKSKHLKKLVEENKYKIYTHFNPERSELFFSNKVLLVEGHSDKILFTTLAEQKWNINLEKENISIVECGGKTGVLYFIFVCKLHGKGNYFAVWDKDKDKDKASAVDDRNIQYFTDTLSEGKGLEISPNLEGFLKPLFPTYNFSENEKVKNAFLWADSVKEKDIPEQFKLVRNFLMSS